MSNIVTNAVKGWQGPPTHKYVLMCLADGAGDDGAVPAWRSSAGSICSWTCLKRTAVTEALKSLEAAGLVAVDRPRGQISTIRLVFEVVDELPNPPGKRCTPADGVPRETVDHPPGKRQGVPRQTVGSTPGNGHLTPLHQTPDLHLVGQQVVEQSKPVIKKPPTKKKTRLTDDFLPNETGMRYASDREVDAGTEVQSFKNHHQSKGNTFLDWQAAWRTWCDNAVKFRQSRAPASGAGRQQAQSRADLLTDCPSSLYEGIKNGPATAY